MTQLRGQGLQAPGWCQTYYLEKMRRRLALPLRSLSALTVDSWKERLWNPEVAFSSAGVCGRNQHVSEVTGPQCLVPVLCLAQVRPGWPWLGGSQTPGWRQRCPSDGASGSNMKKIDK